MPNETPVTVVPETKLADTVMNEIYAGHTVMKPRWYFVLGSAALFGGIAILLSLSVYLTSFISFFFRSHGPRADMRLAGLITVFPWWALFLAVGGIVLGVVFLRRYDFSYKKHFWLIVLGVVLAVLAAGWLMNYFGLDKPLMQRSPMRGFYDQYNQSRNDQRAPGMGRGMMRGGGDRTQSR